MQHCEKGTLIAHLEVLTKSHAALSYGQAQAAVSTEARHCHGQGWQVSGCRQAKSGDDVCLSVWGGYLGSQVLDVKPASLYAWKYHCQCFPC